MTSSSRRWATWAGPGRPALRVRQRRAPREVGRHNPLGRDRTRLGHRLHPELLGELADLRCRIPAVATKGLQKRELAFGGPAGHGLGRHLQDVGHLRSPQVAGSSGCGLAGGVGCHGASLSCGGPDSDGARNETQVFLRPPQQRYAATMLLAATLLGAGRAGRSCRPTQLPAIAPLGCFSASPT
jgi:hypothetical protein